MKTSAEAAQTTDAWETFLRLPDGPPYYQLISGKITPMPSPKAKHQRISMRIAYFIYDFLIKNNIKGELYSAPLDVFLDSQNVYQPDLLFISSERLNELLGEDDKIHGAPDWAAEILSPSNSTQDAVIKKQVYFRSGVKEYWLIDPENEIIEVFTPAENGFQTFAFIEKAGLVPSVIFPELTLKAEEVFG